MSTKLPYRQNVCMLIFRDKDHLFLGEREGQSGVWQFPQGGIEDGFSIEENVLREAEEELGAPKELFKIEKKLNHTHRYDFANPPAYAVGKYRGQEQTFWMVKYLGEDSDINLSKFQQEFQNYCWMTAAEVRKKAESKRLPGYEKALLEFENYFQD